MAIKDIFAIEKKPHKGLLAVEWIIMGYLVLTLLLIMFCYTKLQDPEPMLWGRVRFVATTVAMWGVYRMIPCRFTRFCRIGAQMLLLTWWYADTYELNRVFPNLDHLFAGYEQQLFGCQPALLFSQAFSHPVFSEMMHLGYSSYFPMIALVTLFYFFRRPKEFDRTTFIILTAFFIFYVIFVFLPVTGPQYYYMAAGLDNISHGVFPNVHDYFLTHSEALPMPGNPDGFFYQCVASAHDAGERPTAAFPSSHVGVTVVLLWLVWATKNRLFFWCLLPFGILMFFATFYIQAHYVIDAIAGLFVGTLMYFLLSFVYKLKK